MPPAELLLFLGFFLQKLRFSCFVFLVLFFFFSRTTERKNLGVGLNLIKKVFSWSFQYHCAVLQMRAEV